MRDSKREDGGLDLDGGSGDERTCLRSNLRHILVAEARGLADRMDVWGEGERDTEACTSLSCRSFDFLSLFLMLKNQPDLYWCFYGLSFINSSHAKNLHFYTKLTH